MNISRKFNLVVFYMYNIIIEKKIKNKFNEFLNIIFNLKMRRVDIVFL